MTAQTQTGILKGRPDCPDCAGRGWVPYDDARSFWQLCPCTGQPHRGVIARARLEALEAAKGRALGQLDALRATLEATVRAWRCVSGGAEDRERDFLAALAGAWGAENAVARAALEVATGLDERGVKEMARHLVRVHRLGDRGLVLGRSRGARAGAGSHGYFWCLTANEAFESYRPLFRQALDELATVEAALGRPFAALGARLRATLQEMNGQLRLFGKEAE